jgi:2-polyprenyl-3-methyl-5-hydroxy-6-metoxy-1,4-benzoquinol methylase
MQRVRVLLLMLVGCSCSAPAAGWAFLGPSASAGSTTRGRVIGGARPGTSPRSRTTPVLYAKKGGKTKSKSTPKVALGFGATSKPATPAVQQSAQARAAQQQERAADHGDDPAETEQRIMIACDEIGRTKPHLHEAMLLARQLAVWEADTARMSVLEQAALPARVVSSMNQIKARLSEIELEHDLSLEDVRGSWMEVTWNAVAQGRAHSHFSQSLPQKAQEVMKAIAEAGVSEGAEVRSLRAVDVGCGTGVLAQFIIAAGVPASNIVGIDVSDSMLEEARQQFPQSTFIRANFPADIARIGDGDGSFDIVFLNAVLHHFSNPLDAIHGASRLVKPGGRVVVSHPKGSGSVAKQHRHNPLLAPSTMPSLNQMRAFGDMAGLELLLNESQARSDYYVVVLERTDSLP